jgi:hypothetical protein
VAQELRPIRFQAELQTIERTTIVKLPAEASAALPSRGQVAVVGAIDGHDLRTVVEPDGNRGHWLKLDRKLRQALTAGDGDAVTVELLPTKEWPEPQVPRDLRAALADAPDLAETWGDITPMARWEWVRWVNATRNPETRSRRVEVSISKLRAGRRRPCCFDLAACTDPELSRNGKLVEPVGTGTGAVRA